MNRFYKGVPKSGPPGPRPEPKPRPRSLMQEVLFFLRDIQRSRKGSIGTIDNVYLPQIDRRRLDRLVARLEKEDT